MILIERGRRKATEGVGERTRQCEAPGCIRSGRYILRLLGAYDTRLCKAHGKEWSEAYDSALHGWPDEAHDLATAFKETA